MKVPNNGVQRMALTRHALTPSGKPANVYVRMALGKE
jgi:hypothetical protein